MIRYSLLLGICLIGAMLSGCELFSSAGGNLKSSTPTNSSYLCASSESREEFGEFCRLSVWTNYLLEADSMTLDERKAMTLELGDSSEEKLQKVLLSQSIDTPYLRRLRAQNWLNELKATMDENMIQVAGVLIEQPSQQMLELESAVSILTRMNAGHERSIEELQDIIGHYSAQLQKQRKQVEQLLSVESAMSDGKRSN